jgi:hypothetical protein
VPGERGCRTSLTDFVDSLSEAVAVIDGDGDIVLVNRVCRDFSVANGVFPSQPAPHTEVGTNYLQVCKDAATSESDSGEGARAALEGIQAVLDGKLAAFSLEYPCHAGDLQRWFCMRVTPLASGEPGAVTTHVDVTAYKKAEAAAREAQEQLASMTAAVPGVVYRCLLGTGLKCSPADLPPLQIAKPNMVRTGIGTLTSG